MVDQAYRNAAGARAGIAGRVFADLTWLAPGCDNGTTTCFDGGVRPGQAQCALGGAIADSGVCR